MSQTFEVTGEITRIRLINPHAYLYFDITGRMDDVRSMRCELLPGSTLKRNGWTEDMFAVGTEITVNGSPDRDDPATCYMNEITFENGLVVTRDSAFSGDIPEATIDLESRPLVRDDGRPNIEGNWVMAGPEIRGGNAPSVTLTAAGMAAVADASSDQNPRFNCQTTNIIMDWWFNQNVNSISQSDSEITLRYGFMDLERTIYLDDRRKPADFTPSRAGFSTGVWKDDTLIVTTTGFDEGWISAPLRGRGARSGGNGEAGERPERPRRLENVERPRGSDRPGRPRGRGRGPEPLKNSSGLEVTEEFKLNDDGTVLTRSYVLTDPLYFEGSIAGTDEVTLTADRFASYNCEDLTEEEGWGETDTQTKGVLYEMEDSLIGKITSSSVWGYPIFLSLHAIGMAVMVGISLMLIFRVLGFASSIPVTAMLPYWKVALSGFVVNLVSGTALFFGGASELFFNPAFWTKLSLVFLSLTLTWRLVAICISRNDTIAPGHRKLAGLALTTWVAAIIAGRLIGYMA